MANFLRQIFSLSIILIPVVMSAAISTKLTSDSFATHRSILLQDNWVFNEGDKKEWADPNYDDSGWGDLKTVNIKDEINSGRWNGKCWFRLHIKIDSSLFGEKFGVSYWHSGAAEIFLNGKKIFSMGKPGSEDEEIIKLDNYIPIIQFSHNTDQVIAIRYSNHQLSYFANVGLTQWFSFALGDYIYLFNKRFSRLNELTTMKVVFISIAAILGLLHFFLYWFDRRQRQNLFYTFFLLSFIAFILVSFQSTYLVGIFRNIFFFRISNWALLFTISFGAVTIYSIYSKLPKYFYVLLLIAFLLGLLWFLIVIKILWYISYAFIIIISYLGSRVLYSPKFVKPNGGEWILQYGFMIMGAAGIYQMLMSFGVFGNLLGISVPYIYGVLVFIISMSLSLSRDFAITSKNLEKQLAQVKSLSDKTLKQELEAKEMELQTRILEADNNRKTTELEEARNVQLSMLPKSLNNFPGLDVCFYMQTATEVGGDYYDFVESKDGTLNIAVGDATGHGLRAGIMVATIKSLFRALGSNLIITDFFEKCTEIIKSMTLGNLFMSMTVMRIKNNQIIGSSAGMPPIIVFRGKTGKAEEVVIKSMPLGAMKNFPYETFEFSVESGDLIYIMSDGFPELFNPDREMLGYDAVKKIIENNSQGTASEIVDYMVEQGIKWRKEHLQDDDITFVVIKIK